MRYPVTFEKVIDVTEAPYFADNTGKTDCTEALRKVFDDLLIREIQSVRETEKKLHTLGEKDVYIGFETRIQSDLTVNVIWPEFVPDGRIIFFPKGTYLVSDTVTYTFDHVKNIFLSKPGYELTRGIHIVGESREETVIKLIDHCDGFAKGTKPVLSFINNPDCLHTEVSNVSQLNTLTDLTIDCGKGNAGAVAVRFIANNSGRVENITLKGADGNTGLQLACGSEGVFRNIKISGFETGIYSRKSSVCAFEHISLDAISGTSVRIGGGVATFRNISVNSVQKYGFIPDCGLYTLFENGQISDTSGNSVYTVDNSGEIFENGNTKHHIVLDEDISIPKDIDVTENNFALVEAYGAVADGVTDCTGAIQDAVNSGKEIILFGGGHYYVNGRITVPKTVRKIDFMFCDFFAGEKLISGEADSLFCLNEDSESPFFAEHLYAFEQFYGHFRLFCHSAKRDVVLKDLHTQTAALYFNTTAGSTVYLDNCACTVGTYSHDCIIGRKGYEPEFCNMIPFEFHGQRVFAWNMNPERADVEVLNDHSVLTVFGFKVEGPGTAIQTVHNGKTTVFGFSCGIGDIRAQNPLFFNRNAKVILINGQMFGFNAQKDYNLVLESDYNGMVNRVYKKQLPAVSPNRTIYSLFEG